MPIQNRNLESGTLLVGTYQKEAHECLVELGQGGKAEFVLKDGRRFTSLSSAAGGIMGGKAVNGWLFWSLAPKATEPTLPKRGKSKKLIYLLPNQKGVEEGRKRYWCNACMKSFTSDAAEVAACCPQGHSQGDEASLGEAGAR